MTLSTIHSRQRKAGMKPSSLPWGLLWAAGFLVVAPRVRAAEPPGERMVVPPFFFAVPGVPLKIHMGGALPPGASEGSTLEAECSIGSSGEGQSWTLVAKNHDVGDHAFTLHRKDRNGQRIETAKSVVRVVPADSGAGSELTLLLVGDSLTHMGHYPNEVARLLSEPGNPRWSMLGLHRPSGAREGVRHEGYGGWSWGQFATHFNANKPAGNKRGSSPFLFPNESGEPTLDIARYFRERCDDRKPDIVVFFLGINDCLSADAKVPAAVDARIDRVFQQADLLLAAFRQALPEADFGLCLTPEPNAREAAFAENYKGRYTREGWRKIQFRLVERQLQHFGGRESQGIYVIPTSLVVDPVSDYPANNALHPAPQGFRAIGAEVFAWIKSRLVKG